MLASPPVSLGGKKYFRVVHGGKERQQKSSWMKERNVQLDKCELDTPSTDCCRLVHERSYISGKAAFSSVDVKIQD